MKKYFYERNDRFLNSKLNVTFEEILAMTKEEFRQWCKDICNLIVENWDKHNTPPVVGLNETDMIDGFNRMTGFNSELLWDTDESTGERNVIRNKYHFGAGVNQFFPTMFKTPITVSTKIEGRSIYDFFSNPVLFESFYKSAIRNFKHDSFYHYSLCLKVGDKTRNRKNEPCLDDPVAWVKGFEANYRGRVDYDYWLNPLKKKKEYTGYNKELFDAKYLRLTKEQVKKLPINMHHEALHADEYEIRFYQKGQKLFPLGMKCFKIAYGRQVAVNFPPMIAKALYEKYTDHLVGKQDVINIYDPSMGWGGRILGAMTVRDDRHIHYIGTDPNTDHNTDAGRTKYHEVADFVNTKTSRRNIFSHKNTYDIFQLGSEVIGKNKRFQKYKGKIDLVFTSPPYFAKEVYSDDPEQSCHKFTTYDNWRDGFLRPTLETCVEYMRPGGYLLWNIADAEFDGVRLPLEEDSRKILLKLGMKEVGLVKMALASMPGANRMQESDEYDEEETNTLDGVVTTRNKKFVTTTKNSCVIGGRTVKFEPIFIFRKPK